MKKFILLISVLVVGFGMAWGVEDETFSIITPQTGTGTTGSTSIPFDLTSTSEQVVEMIIPHDLLENFVINMTSYNSNVKSTDFEYISGFSINANETIPKFTNISCTIQMKSIANTNTAYNFSTSGLDLTSSLETFSSSTITSVGTKTTFKLGNNSKFNYKKGNDLYIKITFTISSEQTSTPSELTNFLWRQSSTYTKTMRIGSSTYDYLPQIDLLGSRVVNCIVNGSEYDVHTSSFSATLLKFASSSTSRYYVSRSSKYASDVSLAESDITGDLYYWNVIDEFESPFIINNQNNHKVTITALGATAFNSCSVSENSAFKFSNVAVIGDNNSTNKCFNFNVANGKNVLLIFKDCLPSLYTNDNYSNFVGTNSVHLGVGTTQYNNQYPFKEWKNVVEGTGIVDIRAKFLDTVWTWYPFKVEVNNIHKKNTSDEIDHISMDENTKYLAVSQYPFKCSDNQDGIKLALTLTGIPEAAHDGSWCNYDNITGAYKGTNQITISNSTQVATKITGENTTITVNMKYYTDIIYSSTAYFDYTADKGKVYCSDAEQNNPVLFNNSPKLTFRLDTINDINGNTTGYNINNVPNWKYTNVGDDYHKVLVTPTNEYLNYAGYVHVEKLITSAHYRYFALPFDCPVSSIEVHKVINNNGVLSLANETIPFLTTALEKIDWTTYDSNRQDHFIIEKYMGQQDGTYQGDDNGLPRYQQITDISSTPKLSAYQGYAFAIVQAGENNTVEAVITFKSEQGQVNFYLNTYDGFTIPLSHDNITNETSARNAGWRMIGNPFYHPIGAYCYKVSGNNLKYVTKINDNESVSHYYVGENLSYLSNNGSQGGSYVSAANIQPFEAFFIQAEPGNNKTATIDPTTTAPSNNTSSHSSLLAANPEIKELIMVKATDANGNSDHTGIISDDTRDEHFRIGDDLAKIMNPGIQIYTWYDSVPCAFKELPLREDSTMAIPLGYIAEEDGNYTFSLDTNMTLFYGAAMLHDKQANLYYPIDENGVQVALTAGEVNDRLEIVVVPSELPTDVEAIETSETLDAYVVNGRLVVENIEEGSILSIYDISGKMLYNAPAAGGFNYQFSAHGVYMVVLQGNTTGSIKVVY